MARRNKSLEMKTKVLTVRDIVDVLSYYNFNHALFPHNEMASESSGIPYVYGMTIPERRQIIVNSSLIPQDMRDTVIHELTHARHFLRGECCEFDEERLERYVERVTDLTLKQNWRREYLGRK